MRNIIWQAYERITTGDEPGVGGNLRTFWYRFVKPTLAHIDDDDALKSDPYDRMLWVFGQMVMDWKLFKYADFDLADENWQNRHIGTKHPHIFVFAEKTGWSRWLRSVHKSLGVSVLALGGAPSALTSEFTVSQLEEALGGLEREVHLIGVVDFDPAGDMIASSFREQLGAAGLKKTSLRTLLHPRDYTARELAMFKVPLPRRQATKNKRWVEMTGGVGGAFGLEAKDFLETFHGIMRVLRLGWISL